MTVQEVAKSVIKVTGKTQTQLAEECGFAGQSSIGTFFRSKSMRVDNLLKILNACGYELVARSGDGKHPEFVIGEKLSIPERDPMEVKIEEMVRKAIETELGRKGTTMPEDIGRF
jgi:hypothetical protein